MSDERDHGPPRPEVPEYRRPTMPFDRGRAVPSSALRWSAVGLEFAVAVVLFFLGGKALDAKVGSGPWLSVVGALLGVAVGTYLLIRAALRSESRASGEGPGAGGAVEERDE
jgi:F0F1-type ATP synthase assembly protein I